MQSKFKIKNPSGNTNITFVIATAQLYPANSINWSTLKAYSVNSSSSIFCASSWLKKKSIYIMFYQFILCTNTRWYYGSNSPGFSALSVLLIFLVLCVVFGLFILVLHLVSNVACVPGLPILDYLSGILWFSLMVIYNNI
jgi:hypothetical protein